MLIHYPKRMKTNTIRYPMTTRMMSHNWVMDLHHTDPRQMDRRTSLKVVVSLLLEVFQENHYNSALDRHQHNLVRQDHWIHSTLQDMNYREYRLTKGKMMTDTAFLMVHHWGNQHNFGRRDHLVHNIPQGRNCTAHFPKEEYTRACSQTFLVPRVARHQYLHQSRCSNLTSH